MDIAAIKAGWRLEEHSLEVYSSVLKSYELRFKECFRNGDDSNMVGIGRQMSKMLGWDKMDAQDIADIKDAVEKLLLMKGDA